MYTWKYRITSFNDDILNFLGEKKTIKWKIFNFTEGIFAKVRLKAKQLEQTLYVIHPSRRFFSQFIWNSNKFNKYTFIHIETFELQTFTLIINSKNMNFNYWNESKREKF